MEQNRRSGGARPGALNAAANNTDLWATYLRAGARSWLDPFGLAGPRAVDTIARPLADAAAAIMSGWMSILVAPTVSAMYDANKPEVNRFVDEQAVDPEAIDIPADYVQAALMYPPDPTQLEEWAVSANRDRELVPA